MNGESTEHALNLSKLHDQGNTARQMKREMHFYDSLGVIFSVAFQLFFWKQLFSNCVTNTPASRATPTAIDEAWKRAAPNSRNYHRRLAGSAAVTQLANGTLFVANTPPRILYHQIVKLTDNRGERQLMRKIILFLSIDRYKSIANRR